MPKACPFKWPLFDCLKMTDEEKRIVQTQYRPPNGHHQFIQLLKSRQEQAVSSLANFILDKLSCFDGECVHDACMTKVNGNCVARA
mmetsp:Transcript_48754/g.97275  ORF Transcript_48754/g.97275 Transcript_48754/m.97275 type:complete len:86 (+) Transcript_48754:229-486(+)